MLDYIVPILASIIIQSFINSTPQLTMTPTEAFSNTVSVEVNGKKNSRVFVNGVEVAIIEEDGHVIIDLDTSGADGSKDFEITLHDNANHISKTLSFSLEKTAITRKDAIKLLRQAAFVSDESHIDYIMANGEKAWINDQLNTISDEDDLTDEKYGYLESMTRFLNKNNNDLYPSSLYTNPAAYPEVKDSQRLKIFNRSIWWEKALHNEDQLRQRVAYALSQLIVVGKEGSSHLGMRGEGAAHYYDILVKHAFGNYGDLLKEVSVNPIMADYLTYVASSKDNNITGTAPDENYARELMQLFSVGLYELNDDGTKKLDDEDFPIPTYTQDDVSEMARVFTGWALSSNDYRTHYEDGTRIKLNRNNSYSDTHNYAHSFILPIRDEFAGEYHDYESKTILGQIISSGLTPKEDIKAAVDILMANDNIGPHVCRELINRLVTSNPTPQYMSDVVSVFNDNGKGEKGDLKATIREILTHSEARNVSLSNTYGKVDEFMLLTTHYLSSLNVKALPLFYYLGTEMKDTYWFTPDTQYYHQVPLKAPSVFNFYSPEYIPNDASFSDIGLVAPEFEIRTNNGLIAFANYISYNLNQDKYKYAQNSKFTDIATWAREKKINNGSYGGLYIDTTKIYKKFSMFVDGDEERKFLNLNDNSTANSKVISIKGNEAIVNLIDYLDNHFTGGMMTQEYKDELKRHLATSSVGKNYIGVQAMNIVETAIRGIIMSPAYMVIK